MEPRKATVKEVRDFFHSPDRPMALPEMKEEWIGKDARPEKKLTEKDKEDIMNGIGDGSLTY